MEWPGEAKHMATKVQGLPPKGKPGTAHQIRKDAEGQFAPKQHGARNDGLDSAAPVVTTGDGDATFDNDPDDDGDR
jgi:hypothetical protein